MNEKLNILKITLVLCLINICTTLFAQPFLACNDMVSISMGSYDCSVNITPDMLIEGASCSGCDLEVRIYATDADFQNDTPLPQNNIGAEYVDSLLYYKVEDLDSGNACWGQLLLEDKLPPVAICIADLAAEMPNTGNLQIWATDIDSGSFDNCSDITYQIRRQNQTDCAGNVTPLYTEYLTFEPCANNTIVPIELLVTDVSGNSTYCVANLHIGNPLNENSIREVSLYASHETVDIGGSKCVSVKVGDFTDILGVQFSISWLTEDLSYVGLENLNETLNLGLNNFNILSSTSENLRFSWVAPSNTPISLADNSVLFDVCFDVVAMEDILTSITFENEPTLIEFVGFEDNEITTLSYSVCNGTIAIGAVEGPTTEDVICSTYDASGTPSIVAPEDITVDCVTDISGIEVGNVLPDGDFFPIFYVHQDNPPLFVYDDADDLEYLGVYTQAADDLEGAMDTVYVYDEAIEVGQCGEGTLHRLFKIIGAGQIVTDVQTISIVGESNFNENNITWPSDISVCGIGSTELAEPIIQEDGCSLVATAYEDVFFTENGNVIKAIRTWTVIEWCSEDVWEHSQVITFDENGCVWPGDTNSDGLANHFDLLNLGIGYSDVGVERPSATSTWEGQSCPDWTSSFIEGNNYKHGDCNGDGTIDLLDILPILVHWGNTHNFKEDEDQFLVADEKNNWNLMVQADTLQAGTTASLPIILGSEETQLTDVYGIAFSINYEKDKVVPSTAAIDFSNSWLGTEDENMITIQKDFWNEGRIDVALTRTNGLNVSSQGQICALDIIIEDVIFMNFNSETSSELIDMLFSISNVKLINQAGEEIPVIPESTLCKINTSTTSILDIMDASISIYPNPAQHSIQLKLDRTAEIVNLDIYTLEGKHIRSVLPNEVAQQIDISTMKAGVYILKTQTKEGQILSKLVVQ